MHFFVYDDFTGDEVFLGQNSVVGTTLHVIGGRSLELFSLLFHLETLTLILYIL